MTAVPKIAPTPSRMTLASIQRGRTKAPLRILLHGVPGVGKTTFAASAPGAVFLGREDGGGLLDLARFPRPETWSEVLAAVRTLAAEKHDFKTLVIDTLDSLEPLCWRAVCERDGKATQIEEVGGGYAKGYNVAVDEWRVLIAALERLRDVGMHVVLLAHTAVKNFKNPEGPDYDRYIMKLHEKAGGAFVEWCDTVLFAQFEGYVSTDKKGGKGKGKSSDLRVAYTRRHAAYDAKNRHALPETLPLSWDDFWTAVNAAPDPEKLAAEARELAKGFTGELAQRMSVAIKGAEGNATLLNGIINRINARLAEKAEENTNGDS
jgi:AAA domain